MRDDEPLLRWQWRGYARNHQDPRNLLLHIVAVPMFMAGTVLGLYGLLRLNLPAIALGLVCMGMSMALQGRGHRLEAHAPEPFAGPADIAGRILAEQWITFPRYVLSGQWWRALAGRGAAPAPAPARSGDATGQGG
ncbi:terminase [Cupriavidus alkaliphilus]|uniref:terminase n=1 Tax=Cupriavidus alkaliphilus TaxID=942866 RepID=UPI001614B54D|nr:terminase [Cupriavidus alkaliphilus]MBB2916688.1 phage terminase small subunit [Cupriavidus alkaliphilus]